MLATPKLTRLPGAWLLALAVMSTSLVSLGIASGYERYYGALSAYSVRRTRASP